MPIKDPNPLYNAYSQWTCIHCFLIWLASNKTTRTNSQAYEGIIKDQTIKG